MRLPARGLFAVLSAVAPAVAQDMVGVDWDGTIYAFDSYTGATAPIGVGLPGQNALARDSSGTLWSNGTAIGFGPVLTRVDGITATASPAVPVSYSAPSIRGLAPGPGASLYAVVNVGPTLPNRLLSIDTATGAVTLIGSTGVNLIQGLTVHNGDLLAWDLTRGLGVINPANGLFNDVSPFTGAGNIQWLAVRSDGQLVGGGIDYFAIDRASGATSLLAAGIPYLRGAETAPLAAPFGIGCSGGAGNVELSVAGSLTPGGFVSTTSVGHSGFVYGAILIGTSRTNYAGVALPLLLDPLLGTQGCSLYVAPEISRLGVTTGAALPAMVFVFQIPAGLPFATLHLQHVAFDPVPGGVSTSNGVTVHVTN